MTKLLDMEALKKGLEKYAPDYLKDVPPVKIEGEGEEAELAFGEVVVQHGTEIRKSIAQEIDVPAFSIGTYVCYPGGHWNPDEYDFQEAMTVTNVYSAIALVISHSVFMRLDARLQADGEYAYWQEQTRLENEYKAGS